MNYWIQPVEVFQVSTGKAERTYEVHEPLGYRVATFATYGGACRYVKRQTGARFVQAFLAPLKKTP